MEIIFVGVEGWLHTRYRWLFSRFIIWSETHHNSLDIGVSRALRQSKHCSRYTCHTCPRQNFWGSACCQCKRDSPPVPPSSLSGCAWALLHRHQHSPSAPLTQKNHVLTKRTLCSVHVLAIASKGINLYGQTQSASLWMWTHGIWMYGQTETTARPATKMEFHFLTKKSHYTHLF